jgi:hypothetical protein
MKYVGIDEKKFPTCWELLVLVSKLFEKLCMLVNGFTRKFVKYMREYFELTMLCLGMMEVSIIFQLL